MELEELVTIGLNHICLIDRNLFLSKDLTLWLMKKTWSPTRLRLGTSTVSPIYK